MPISSENALGFYSINFFTMKTSKQPNKSINFSSNNPKVIGNQIRKQNISVSEIGTLLKEADSVSDKSVYAYTKALLSTQKTKEQFVLETTPVFETAVTLKSPARKMMFSAVIDETGRAGSLFLVQNISGLKKKDARACMRDFLDSEGKVTDIADWLQYAGQVLRKNNVKSPDTAGVVVDAIGDAAEWLVDTLEDGVDAIIEAVDAIIDAATSAGAALVDLFEEVVFWTVDQIGNLLTALIEAGRELVEFVAATFAWAYSAVSKFVEAAFAVGFAIADLLATVVSESYFVLRRFVNGIIENLGPIGEILDFVLTQIEDATSQLWRQTLMALRYAEASLLGALDWMADQTAMVFEAIIIAWESIGESLMTIYEWAITAGNAVWWAIGEATATIGNSIYYIYNFLTTSGVEYLFDYTRGLLDAGMAVAGLIGWAVDQSLEVAGEIFRAALDAGATVGEMLAKMARNPRNSMTIFLQAMQDIGQTLDDLLQATFIETAEEFMDEVVEALLEIGHAVIDLLETTLKLGGAMLANLVAHLLNQLGTYRSLSPEEEADARLVFGNSLDYELIYLSNEDPLNKIIFGIQDLFTKNPDSRAFVTGNLINFDPSDNNFDRSTLIHELTHVWQHRTIGGIYMANAIVSQGSGDCFTSGYNYGYSGDQPDSINIERDYNGSMGSTTAHGCETGSDGETALNQANGDFMQFNEEQQGQILMHWFVRTQLRVTDASNNPVVLDSAAWDPYQQFVFNS